MFHGRIRHNVLHLEFGFGPHKTPFPNMKNAQDLLAQTETFDQDCLKNAMQAYIKYNSFYDEKSHRSKVQTDRLRLCLTGESRLSSK